jgi:hypothetical protein
MPPDGQIHMTSHQRELKRGGAFMIVPYRLCVTFWQRLRHSV